MKIIVYGIGKYFQDHEAFLPKDAEIVAYGDRSVGKATSCTGEKFRGKSILLPAEIKNIEYDYIYIATGHGLAVEICEELRTMGFLPEKIRFLYRLDSWREWDYWIDDAGIMVSDIGGIKIREKDRSDYGVLSEVFAKSCYGIDIVKSGTVVIDLGMNIGAATLFFASNPNVEKVYGFEPFPDTYGSALENIHLNDETIQRKIRTFNCAAADFDGDREIGVLTEFSGGRTTEIHVVDNAPDRRTIKIKYCDAGRILEDIIAENERKHIVLKIDTEGSEFAIFRSIRKMLKRIDAVVMEYHRDPKELLAVLRENGYRCITAGVKSIGLMYAINMDETLAL